MIGQYLSNTNETTTVSKIFGTKQGHKTRVKVIYYKPSD